jgi:predicted transcriptional regulator
MTGFQENCFGELPQNSAILTLKEHGWSQRRIARELGIHLDTVSRYIHLSGEDSKPAKAPSGSDDANAHNETSGRSQCESFREVIEDKLQGGLSRQRIYQDLRDEHGFKGSYYSVRRFVKRLGADRPIPFRRMECMPGEQAQIDFGTGAPVVRPDGKRKRPHVFRIVLSFSRKGYSEAAYHQTTDNFIRCLECQDCLFLGPPGTGKSHLVQVIGYHAIKSGFTVRYRSIFDAVRNFLQDEAFASQENVMTKYLKPDLLIIDDMGIKQLPKRSGEYLFEIIMRRYETKPTIMTSNRPLEDWGKLLGDVPSATAILDRFLHNAEIITITGRSYRLKERAGEGNTQEEKAKKDESGNDNVRKKGKQD